MTEDDWLRQIAADRDNEGLRLIFADWLEEHGDADRAEFIRAQVRRETARPKKVYWAMHERQHALLTKHRDAWLAEMPKTVRTSCTFERGFVVRLGCTASQWLRNAKRICAAHPLLEWLDLHSFQAKHVQQLAASPLLVQLTALSLSNRIMGDAETAMLAASPHLTRLTHLRLVENQIGGAGGEALAASPYLAGLTRLDLSHNQLGDRGAVALAESPCLHRLGELNLMGNQIGAEGAAALAAAPHLAQLRKLNLWHNRIGDAGARALASSRYLTQLTNLDVQFNEISPRARALLRKRFRNALSI